MKLLKVIICLHLLGLIVFNLMGLLHENWTMAYYIWDKSVGSGFMLWYILYELVPYSNKWVIRPVLLLATIRFTWQIIAFAAGWTVNNQWWLALFFMLLTIGCGLLMFSSHSKVNRWLAKHLNL